MKKIEIVSGYSEEFNKDISVLAVDEELFDWGLDPDSWAEAKKVISQHSELTETVTTSILNHFCECFSEFVGRNMTLQEINEAIEKGYIE
jgi:hypothetical protein